MSRKSAQPRRLLMEYEAESDTLWVGNGQPALIGHDLAGDAVIVFMDADHSTPVGLMLCRAAGLLYQHLSIGGFNPVPHPPRPDMEISYDAASDTLRMGNGRPQQLTIPIVENAATVSFQLETGRPADMGGRIPSGVTIHHARRRIEAAIQSGLSELAGERAAANANPVAGNAG